jgi:hypothetical protein
MKKKLQFAFVAAFLGGIVGFFISFYSYRLSTTWPARGVPVWEWLWNCIVIHGLPGGLVGLTIGFLFGIAIPKSLITRLSFEIPEYTLKPVAKIIIFLVMLLTTFVYFYFFDPTLLAVAINACILLVIYTVGVYLFGVPKDKS